MFTLIVMAAGFGRRFGGDKQLAAVGPDGEIFLDYAIVDAVAAGASRVVLIVRREIEADMRRLVSERHGRLEAGGVEFAFVRQDAHGPRRAKPWGTAHAVLSAAAEVPGAFVVCNADDYYGSTGFASLAALAAKLADGEAGLCGYRLGLTLPSVGTVSRGVCEVSDGRLLGIVEHHGVRRGADGAVCAAQPEATLRDDALVSMNLWAFPKAAFDWIEDSFGRFLAASGDDAEAECLLPTAVARQMAAGALSVTVLTCEDAWIGVTNPADLEAARTALSHRRIGLSPVARPHRDAGPAASRG